MDQLSKSQSTIVVVCCTACVLFFISQAKVFAFPIPLSTTLDYVFTTVAEKDTAAVAAF